MAHHAMLRIRYRDLPAGSMGWPFAGETLAYIRPHPATSPEPFVVERTKRYGKIFKTSILGAPTIISTDPSLSKFMLLNDGRLFRPRLPSTITRIIGRTSLLTTTGDEHRFLKGLCTNFLGIHRLKDHFLDVVEQCTLQVLDSWHDGACMSAVDETRRFSFNLIIKKMLGLEPGQEQTERLRKAYTEFKRGIASLPLNLPGFSYRKSLQARKTILGVVDELVERKVRRRDGTCKNKDDDFLGIALENPELTREQLGDLILILLFGGHDTTSTTICLAMYFLHACPQALSQLRDEHLAIFKKKFEKGRSKLTWEDYILMNFTQCVTTEILRLCNRVRNSTRMAAENVHYQGFCIPKGWNLTISYLATHLNSDVYENPQAFNPWRWQTKTAETLKRGHYMPFGLGPHKCVGMDLGKLEIATFLHHLVLKYEWEFTEPDEPINSMAIVEFPKGLPVKVHSL